MAEVLHGNANGNQLNVAENRTQIYGLSGNDTLTADGKSDVLLVGGSGDDSLIMSGGNGTLAGGAGADTFELNYSAAKSLSAVIEDLNPSEDKIVVNFDGNTAPELTSSVSGNDVVLSDGELLNVTLNGVRDNDYFDGTGNTEKDSRIFEILKLTNDERENPTKVAGHEKIVDNASNLPWLTLSDGLSKAASIRAEEIAELGTSGLLTNHTRPNGKNWYTVFDDYRVGKHYSGRGENITAGASTAKKAMEDLIGSLSHHKNILNIQPETDLPIDYRKLGVGYEFVPEVVYDGEDSNQQHHYWTQLFGGSLSAGEMETVSTADLLTANPEVHTISTAVTLTENPDTYSNSVFGATIAALGGDDSITNGNLKVSISGGNDNDTIDNSGSFTTINAGTGNDSINLAAQEILIQYAAGDGNDTISGLNSSDTLSISGGEYMPVTVGNDVVVGVGADSITLTGAARSNVQIVGTRSKLYLGTEGDDTIKTDVNGATIQALGGNDSITNDGGANVLFIHESGDDTIGGFNDTSTLQIASGSYDSFSSGNDLILRSDADSIKILGAGGLSSINITDANGNSVNVGNAKDIRGTEQADNLSNDLDGATIRAFGGDDTITNSGAEVSIYGGTGNDSVNNNQKQRTVYIYESGDDTIEGFNDSDSLNIGDYTSDTEQSGNDIIVKIINGSATVGTVTLKDYSGQEVNIHSTASNPGNYINNSTDSVSVVGSPNDDTIRNYGSNVTIDALAGKDYIGNYDSRVTINGGTGDDTVRNEASLVAINGDAGNDSIRNEGTLVTIDGGAGSDRISINSNHNTINGGDDDDYIINRGGYNVTINGGDDNDLVDSTATLSVINGDDGNDTLDVTGQQNTINGGNGEDSIYSSGTSSFINGGDNNDTIYSSGFQVTINGGAGADSIHSRNLIASIFGGTDDDTIYNSGMNVTMLGGAGDDTIYNSGTSVTILGGAGDDRISLSSSSWNNYIRYDLGDGYDTIWGITGNDTVNLPEVAELNSANSRITSLSNPEDNLIIRVRTNGVITGEITLVEGMKHPPHFTFGESETDGRGSIGNDSDGNSASGSGGRGGNDGGNTSGGTSGKEGMTSDFSGGRSAVGSRGRSSSTSTDTSGGTVRATSSRGSGKKTASAMNLGELMSALTPATQPTTNQRIYNGGNMAVSDYQSGEKIIFNEIYTGSFYDEAGNYFVGSSTGALVIQNAPDKVIDLQDVAGNSFLKAYAATTAGVIDGRGLGGFEVINGSAGADAIFAGDGGSQLWGGADVAADVLIGGGGTDIFIVSKYQGSDFIANASSADIVHLIDASLSDIVATAEDNGAIAVAFNTGNVVGVQSSEALSATFMLADGSAYRYNHANKSWQTA